MKKALVIGGNSGIGLAITARLLDGGYEHVYIVGKSAVNKNDIACDKMEIFEQKTSFKKVNLINDDYCFLDEVCDIDTLVFTAGFGRVALFENLNESEITNLIKCNMIAAIRVIKHFYHQLSSKKDFYCAVMGSISGHVASPFFSVYGASKMGLCGFVENINIELERCGSQNRILDVSPGSVKGTNFSGAGNDLTSVIPLADSIIERMKKRETLFIPEYEETFADVIKRYRDDPIGFGKDSFDYKKKSGRVSDKPSMVVGYLSGTFDLFHIGHLNLLKRAKNECDYLIVGVHKSGAWKGKETYIPHEERMEIVRGIKYVDEVIESYPEDSDAYLDLHYDKLFVGSDYKGTERFEKYERFFADKGVEIVYFPYTKGTSSTQLRAALTKNHKSEA